MTWAAGNCSPSSAALPCWSAAHWAPPSSACSSQVSMAPLWTRVYPGTRIGPTVLGCQGLWEEGRMTLGPAGKHPGAGGLSWPPQLHWNVTRHWPVPSLLSFSFHSLQPLFAHGLFILTSGRWLLPAHPAPRAGLPLTWQLSSVGESRCNLARVFPCCDRVTPQYRVLRMVSAWVNDQCYYRYRVKQNSWLGSVWADRATSAAISGQERWRFAIVA